MFIKAFKLLQQERFRCSLSALSCLLAVELIVAPSLGQLQAGVYDFGQSRFGEKRGNFTPGEWLSLILLIMTICLGLALSIGLCYYVNKRQAQKSSSHLNYLKRQHVQASSELIAEEARDAPQSLVGGSTGRLSQTGGTQPKRAFQDSADDDYQDYDRRRFQQKQQQLLRQQERQLQQQQQQQQRQTPNASLVVQI